MKQILIIALSSLFMSSAMAFDAKMDSDKAIDILKNTDCKVDTKECHYIASVEVASFFDACQQDLNRRFKLTAAKNEFDEINSWLTNWKALDPADLKTAVLDPENKLKKRLVSELLAYFKSASSEEVGVECARMGMVKENAEPEKMSDLLKYSKNYKP